MRRVAGIRRFVKVLAALSIGGGSLAGMSIAAPLAGASSAAPITYTTSQENMQVVGTVNFAAIAGEKPAATATPAVVQPAAASSGRLGRPHPAGNHGTPITAGNNFSVVRTNVAGETGVEGVTGPEEASVNIPNPVTPTFSNVEPPDQATCAGPDASGNPITFDFVNDAAAAYGASGNVVWPVTPAWGMLDQPASAFLSDPRCYYDADTQRWFFSMFVSAQPGPAATPQTNTQFLAVSQTSDPLGEYTVFGLDTTDVNNPLGDCPCFGDFDQIGADANGFYITTNEFSNITDAPANAPGYNGTVLYAVSKQGLEAAADGTSAISVARYAITADPYGFSADGPPGTSGTASSNGPYHLSPATTPPGGTYAPNTEYFPESNSDLFADNHLVVYALTGTNALATGGTPTLSATELSSEAYAFPPSAGQKNGPLPLGATFGYHRSPPALEADFNALQESVYTAGNLYTELDTATVPSADAGHDGVAWFDLAPSVSGSSVSASVASQGYVSTTDSLIYPALVVDGSGNGYLDFTMTGTSDYPSAAYVSFTGGAASGPIHVAAAGAAPEDGFTCYPPFSTPAVGCRWGDYSAGAVWNGRAYLMTEYIPSSPRDTEANFGTFIWSAPIP
ncbi:MAG: hypothetical protein FWC87_01860 [Acidimicrobiaceae bacterium]|nr:hypothetical protein [Acidimicrobiaceae bacterium]